VSFHWCRRARSNPSLRRSNGGPIGSAGPVEVNVELPLFIAKVGRRTVYRIFCRSTCRIPPSIQSSGFRVPYPSDCTCRFTLAGTIFRPEAWLQTSASRGSMRELVHLSSQKHGWWWTHKSATGVALIVSTSAATCRPICVLAPLVLRPASVAA